MLHKQHTREQAHLDSMKPHYDRDMDADCMIQNSTNSFQQFLRDKDIQQEEIIDEIRNPLNPKCLSDENDPREVNSHIALSYTAEDSDSYDNIDLNSSPVKSNFNAPTQNENIQYSSSPVKKKSVAFSDELVTEYPSSPGQFGTPKKSILKPNLGHQNADFISNGSILSIKNSYNKGFSGPDDPSFWIQGNVVQLQPGSPELSRLLEGCLKVLKNTAFKRRFEVYATLNYLYRSNSQETLFRIFTRTTSKVRVDQRSGNGKSKDLLNDSNYISELSDLIRLDVTGIESNFLLDNDEKENFPSPSKNNPFSIRVISQALRFLNALILDSELHNFIPLDNIQWIYEHSCQMLLKRKISKALVSPYLLIIKDYKSMNKKRRNVIESSDIPDRMLHSILSMKYFPSGSIITEKFNTLKNLVINFPLMMQRNINLWFPIFIMDICTLNSQAHLKSVNTGVHVLLEITKEYLNNEYVTASVRDFLCQPLDNELVSIIPHNSTESPSNNISKELNIDFIISFLSLLIDNGHYKLSMDIWVAITLLIGDVDVGIENWSPLTKWLKVHKRCFNVQNESAKIDALVSWRAIIFNICCRDISNIRKYVEPTGSNSSKVKNQSIHETLRPKIKLLLHLLLNITSIENENNIINTMHQLFLSIVYHLFNPISLQQSSKYAHIYWDKIVQPVLVNFYFKKEVSNKYMNQLGIDIMVRFLKNNTPVTERNYSELRCLANEPVTLNEINSPPARWIFSRFDRFLRNIALVFQLGGIELEQKLSLFNSFINKIKAISKKEIKTSNLTFDLIDNIPLVLQTLLNNHELSEENLRSIIINLHDAFNPADLMIVSTQNEKRISNNIYLLIIENCSSYLDRNSSENILNLIVFSLSDKKALLLLYNLMISDSPKLSKDFKDIVSSMIERRKIDLNHFESELYGDFVVSTEVNSEKLIDNLKTSLLVCESDDLHLAFLNLKVSKWPLHDFIYFLKSLKDVPKSQLNFNVTELISQRFDTDDAFIDILKVCLESGLYSTLYDLREGIVSKSKGLEGFLRFDFRHTWKSYLQEELKSSNFERSDKLLLLTYKETEIDIKSFVRNEWDNLPSLKAEWLKHNESVYIDQALIRFQKQEKQKLPESDETEERQDKSFESGNIAERETKNDLNSNTSGHFNDEDTPCSDTIKGSDNAFTGKAAIQSKDEPPLSTPKTKKRSILEENTKSISSPRDSSSIRKGKTRKSKSVKSSKEPKSTPVGNKNKKTIDSPQSQFDIHSFTALLTQKLSPSKESAKRKTKNTKTSSQASSPITKRTARNVSVQQSEPADAAVNGNNLEVEKPSSSNYPVPDTASENEATQGVLTRSRRNKRSAKSIEGVSTPPSSKRRSRRIAMTDPNDSFDNSQEVETPSKVCISDATQDIMDSTLEDADAQTIQENGPRGQNETGNSVDISVDSQDFTLSQDSEILSTQETDSNEDHLSDHFEDSIPKEEFPFTDGSEFADLSERDVKQKSENDESNSSDQICNNPEEHEHNSSVSKYIEIESRGLDADDNDIQSGQGDNSILADGNNNSALSPKVNDLSFDRKESEDVIDTETNPQSIRNTVSSMKSLDANNELFTSKVFAMIENVTDDELRDLTIEDRHILETTLMQFMLRMRNLSK